MKRGTRVMITEANHMVVLRGATGYVVREEGGYVRVHLDVPLTRQVPQLRMSDNVPEVWFPKGHVVPEPVG